MLQPDEATSALVASERKPSLLGGVILLVFDIGVALSKSFEEPA
jgi:hypothetical protein